MLARCKLSRALSHIKARLEGSDATTRIVPFLLFSEDIPVTFSRRELGLGLQVGEAEPGGTQGLDVISSLDSSTIYEEGLLE
jgi:hypothetical protein